MSFNPAKAVEIPLSVFGSLVTEMNAVDLPEGVSPDNQDVVYVPGNVSSRPGLHKVFATPFGSATVTYAKSFIDPTGIVRNLYLDSLGNIWVENLSSAPGTYTLLGATTPGTYAKSITAFGREYIAISDGLHGQEVPLQYDGTFLDRVTQDGPGAPPAVANLAIAPQNITSLTRTANVVTAVMAAPHGLQVGYQAQVAGVPATVNVGGSIASVVINNEDNPGIATVTTTGATGLSPGISVGLVGIYGELVGGGITAISRVAQVTNATTATAHNLAPGSRIQILGYGANFDGTATVSEVIGPNNFTFIQVGADATGTTGTVTLLWPIPDASTPQLYQVLSAPTADSFTIALNYSDGTWTTGIVTFQWDGTFFVASVISPTDFTYMQYGPDASSGATGTITPFGQVSPGQHQMQVLFLTRQGAITAPSPPVQFVANGGQYLAITNIPIGPSNVVARILAFTGAQGAFFFYIPVPAQINGQVVSTATQINDNTTTSATLDFSDNTLFAALGINTQGNNLPAQIVLDGALGFGFFGNRLLAYGQRNRIQNFLNMSFDGGYLSGAPTVPLGWTVVGSGGALAPGHYGQGWLITLSAISGTFGQLQQSGYLDAYGAPITDGNTPYLFRCWLKVGAVSPGLSFTVTISSILASFTSTATIPGSQMSTAGGWVQAAFSLPTPETIPSDLLLTIEASGATTTLLIDEMSIIFADQPYLETILFGSYINNPEGFDGVTGKFGASDDTHKVMDFGIIRANLYILTQDPSGRIHAVSSNNVTEPAGWTIEEIAANCGLLSAFGLTKSQADDSSAGGGEEWFAWASSSGARIFGGDQPWKLSQEIQPNWSGDANRGFLGINFAAAATIWALNDPVARVMYFGIPSLDVPGPATAPNLILPMNYRELETPFQISSSAPVHTSFSGRLLATDNTRKWTRWNLPMNGAALMYRAAGQVQPVFFSGNGTPPGVGGFGNIYTLDPAKLTDDDYGQIFPYYVTFFFVNHDAEIALQLGAHRKMISYGQFLATGVGIMTLTILRDSLTNPASISFSRYLKLIQNFDQEVPGGSATAQRFALKFASTPLGPMLTDNSFSLQKVVLSLKPSTHLPVRGSAT